MLETRRSWILLTAGMAGTLALFPRASFGQNPRQPPTQFPFPPSGRDSDPMNPDGLNPPAVQPKAVLDRNQKEMRESVAKLFKLASELKKEVDKTDSTEVLSLSLIRKADEIEKLAKHIKERAKG